MENRIRCEISCREPVCFAPQYLLEILTRCGLFDIPLPDRGEFQPKEYGFVQKMVLGICLERGRAFRNVLELHSRALCFTPQDIESLTLGIQGSERDYIADTVEGLSGEGETIKRGLYAWTIWNAMVPIFGAFGNAEQTDALKGSVIFDAASQAFVNYGKSLSSHAKLSLLDHLQGIGALVSDPQFNEKIGVIHYQHWRQIKNWVCTYAGNDVDKVRDWLESDNWEGVFMGRYISPQKLAEILRLQPAETEHVVETVNAGFSPWFLAAAASRGNPQQVAERQSPYPQVVKNVGAVTPQKYRDTQTELVLEALERTKQQSATMPAIIGGGNSLRLQRYADLTRGIIKRRNIASRFITSEVIVIREVLRDLLNACTANLKSPDNAERSDWEQGWDIVGEVLAIMSVVVQETLQGMALVPNLYEVQSGKLLTLEGLQAIKTRGSYDLCVGKIPREIQVLFLTWLGENLKELSLEVLSSWPKDEFIVRLTSNR